jgi:hypothetical protein
MDYLSIFIGRFVLLFLGIFGNVMGIAVFYRKNMNKISTNKIYRLILFLDTFFLSTQIFQDSALSLGLDLRSLSTLSCKIRYYWNYSIGPVSPWLLVYITIERYVAIKYTSIKILKQHNFQKLIIVLIFIYNLGIYSPFAILKQVYSSIDNNNETYYYCDFEDNIQYTIMTSLDLINSALLPFFIMTASSCALIHTILRVRLRILDMRSKRDKKKLRRDIRFGVSSIALNIFFVILNLPLCVTNIFFPLIDDFTYNIFIIIFYAIYCINSYILFFFNSIFRNEFLVMLKLRKEVSKTNVCLNSNRTKKNTGEEPKTLNNKSKDVAPSTS